MRLRRNARRTPGGVSRSRRSFPRSCTDVVIEPGECKSAATARQGLTRAPRRRVFVHVLTPRTRFIAARLVYVAVVLVATVTQLEFSPDLAAAAQRLARAFTPSLGWRDAIDGLRNAALFGGLGVVWVVSSPSGRVRAEIWRATLVALVLSATVEGLQVFSPVRTASIVDVPPNTLGARGGALIMALLVTAVVRARDRHFLLGVPTFLLAGAYALATLCEAVTPLFRSDRLPGVEGGPLTLLDTMLDRSVPLRPGEVPLFDVLLYAPAGFLVATWLLERVGSERRVWPAVAGVGAGLAFVAQQFLLYLPLGSVLAVWPLRRSQPLWPAVWLAIGIEAGHIVIADRFFDLTNALVSCAGLGIGWLVVQRSGFTPHREASAGGRHSFP